MTFPTLPWWRCWAWSSRRAAAPASTASTNSTAWVPQQPTKTNGMKNNLELERKSFLHCVALTFEVGEVTSISSQNSSHLNVLSTYSQHLTHPGLEQMTDSMKIGNINLFSTFSQPQQFLNIPPISTYSQHMPHFKNCYMTGDRWWAVVSWSSVDFVVRYLPLTCWVVGSFKLSSGYSSW